MSGSTDLHPLLDGLYRRDAGRIVATLTRAFGAAHLELAEDVVQEAMMQALQDWPARGVPDDPAGWLYRVARNLAIDRLRRDTRGQELLRAQALALVAEARHAEHTPIGADPSGVVDDQLRMLFACCHPSLSREQQVALALRTLCGFSVPEIARAFLAQEATINKRLYRAREAFRALGRIALPDADGLLERLDHVLAAIYLLFNEGYASTEHTDPIREDLIEEALRLCDMLVRHPRTDQPSVRALLALMLFHAARSEARTTDGGIVLLAEQDRSRWDRRLIHLADHHLATAAQGTVLSTYHVEAMIASVHAHAPAIDATDWPRIVALYDTLMLLAPSPVVALNRVIAVGQVEGPLAAHAALEALPQAEHLPYYHAAKATFLSALGRTEEARAAYDRAIANTRSPAEAELLRRKRAGV